MRRYTTRLRATALALAVCSLLATGCHTASVRPSEIFADSISGFSGEQGANGWSYGYWDRTADTDKSYSPKTDFQMLRHFGSDIDHPSFTTGNRWILQDGLYFTALWAEGGSSNGTWGRGTQVKVEHCTVRRWVSTANGSVTINGHIAKILPWGSRDCPVHIVVDGATVFSAVIDPSGEWDGHSVYIGGTNYSVNATVRIGSLVDFLITAGPPETDGAFGPFKFTATIRAASALP